MVERFSELAKRHLLITIGVILIFLLLLIYKKYSELIYALTAVIIYVYTYETYLIRKKTEETFNLTQNTQSLQFLSTLINYNEQMRPRLADIYLGKGSLEDRTAVCNLVDNIGQIAFWLSEKDREILLDRWAAIFIRLWIRLHEFVKEKRKISLGRDYPYFEWVASKSLHFMQENYPKFEINFYQKNNKGDSFELLEADLIKKYSSIFREPEQIVIELIRTRGGGGTQKI